MVTAQWERQTAAQIKFHFSFLTYISNYFSYIHNNPYRTRAALFSHLFISHPNTAGDPLVDVQRQWKFSRSSEKKCSTLPASQRKWAGDPGTLRCRAAHCTTGIEKIPEQKTSTPLPLTPTGQCGLRKPQLWPSSTQTWELSTLHAFLVELYFRKWQTSHRIEY